MSNNQVINKEIKISKNVEKDVILAKLAGIYAFKTFKSEITYCNNLFLEYIGAKNVDQVIGQTDFDFPWEKYASYYRNHELDALEGNIYSAIHPGRDILGREILFLNTKYPRYDDNGNLMGLIGHAIEIVNPNMIQLSSIIAETDIVKTEQNYTLGKRHHLIKLTARESEILFYVIRGKSAKTIARVLSISPRTVETHIESLKTKFNCKNKCELICRAAEEGFANNIPTTLKAKLLIDGLQH